MVNKPKGKKNRKQTFYGAKSHERTKLTKNWMRIFHVTTPNSWKEQHPSIFSFIFKEKTSLFLNHPLTPAREILHQNQELNKTHQNMIKKKKKRGCWSELQTKKWRLLFIRFSPMFLIQTTIFPIFTVPKKKKEVFLWEKKSWVFGFQQE